MLPRYLTASRPPVEQRLPPARSPPHGTAWHRVPQGSGGSPSCHLEAPSSPSPPYHTPHAVFTLPRCASSCLLTSTVQDASNSPDARQSCPTHGGLVSTHKNRSAYHLAGIPCQGLPEPWPPQGPALAVLPSLERAHTHREFPEHTWLSHTCMQGQALLPRPSQSAAPCFFFRSLPGVAGVRGVLSV